ncbi:class II aldolase/adducin family protein [Amycolatopsis pigmentata]|uniref:Class II aldolase/adducin family protein n=1 Tax=Amycolatopsis pigmentata TaxID=450801 RepID=A0ABW5FZ84_9PSEU
MTDPCQDLRKELTLGYRILGMRGLGLGLLAHLTARLPGSDTFWTYQFGQSVEEVRIRDLREVDFELNVVRGEGTINPSLRLHGEIYAARPDVVCIAHHHGDNAVALGALDQNLVPFDRNAARWEGEIDLTTDIESLPLAEQGPVVARLLAKNKALLMKHHGVIVTGTSVADAVVSTIELERSCGVQLKVMAAGEPVLMTQAEIDDSRVLGGEVMIKGTWDYYVRTLHRRGLDSDID